MYSKAQTPNHNPTGTISNNPEIVAKDSLKALNDMLSSSHSQKLMALWNDDKDFQNLFNDKLIDFNDLPVNIVQKLNDLSLRFKRILMTQRSEFIKVIWDANPLLQAWFSAEKINFNQNKQGASAALYSISFEESLENFKKALTSGVNALVMDIWNKNALLCSWYTAQETQMGYDQTGEILKQTISMNALIDFFERCHIGQCEPFNRFMWEVNPYLRQWVKGHAINIVHNNGYNEMQVISFKQMIKMFSSPYRTFSQKLWEENVTFQNYLFGKEVMYLGISYTITPDELSNLFKKISKEKQAIIIRAINKNNQFLKNWLNGESVQADSDEINKAGITAQCNGALQSKQVATNLLDTNLQAQAKLGTNPVNLGSIAMPCRSISQEEKSPIIAIEEDNWSSLIKRLPIAKKNNFFVDYDTSMALNKFSQQELNELSIESIVPITYQVSLKDHNMYNQTQKKYGSDSFLAKRKMHTEKERILVNNQDNNVVHFENTGLLYQQNQLGLFNSTSRDNWNFGKDEGGRFEDSSSNKKPRLELNDFGKFSADGLFEENISEQPLNLYPFDSDFIGDFNSLFGSPVQCNNTNQFFSIGDFNSSFDSPVQCNNTNQFFSNATNAEDDIKTINKPKI